ncbi:hypothetical protein F5J12DRAFT_418296 [Pisolithus orientalis]|uniref:uncharacterized protein n=1 Tax=Pisolithus orientalis TaxID=936130 RepID=UPI0022249794|nr:uncharacterized protein F5J12DRAFT_418296 [Pisolithus orientalis]KAI5994067.1 hypothetical protein F5J12DRAFT_418296 [Pisolithus orientalis]
MVLNVLVMGEIGSGKSSVVNLLVGRNVAEISSGTGVCTLKTTRHEATVESMKVHIWEVKGFNEPDSNTGKNLGKDTATLGMELGPILNADADAKVDVILLCMLGPKVKMTTTRIFESVSNVLGRHIPIVSVVTGLELEKENIKNWWDRNQKPLTRMGLQGTEHACITGLQGTKYAAISKKSRESLVSILEDQYSRGGNTISLESVLKEHIRQNGGYKKRTLMKQFKLDEGVAQRLLQRD